MKCAFCSFSAEVYCQCGKPCCPIHRRTPHYVAGALNFRLYCAGCWR